VKPETGVLCKSKLSCEREFPLFFIKMDDLQARRGPGWIEVDSTKYRSLFFLFSVNSESIVQLKGKNIMNETVITYAIYLAIAVPVTIG
jgi:hypothetical protein